ncbi:hypothetical protein JRI60_13430 [Archangium violaceum]|nr:hypothetical protein JRI60_13430 [Archangium violaceum]
MEGERLELTDTKALYWLGPDLTLRRCTLILGVGGRSLCLSSSRLIDCTIQVKRQLGAKAWTKVALKGCRFKGRYTSCDFGPWYGYTEGWEQGAVEDCDFSEAQLDGCRFHGCDVRTLRLPVWPCFTIVDPLRWAAELHRVTWPGHFGEVVVADLASEPRSTTGVTWHAPSVAKRMNTTPEELKVAIERFDFIVY